MTSAKRHQEIVLAGSGGQGLVLTGILLAEAALLEGRRVVQTQSYGIATRGGLSLAEVIVDDEEILFQQVRVPDCVLALTEEALRKYEVWAARGVPVLYDSTLAKERSGARFLAHPFTRIASELGNAGSVNILALGALVAHTGVVAAASLEQLIRSRFRGAVVDANLEALRAGAALCAGVPA